MTIHQSIVLRNRMGCELQTWESLIEFTRDIQCGYVIFEAGDQVTFGQEPEWDAALLEDAARFEEQMS